jgi:hypothetical protein
VPHRALPQAFPGRLGQSTYDQTGHAMLRLAAAS